MLRAALYARVSTRDGSQTAESQLTQLRDMARTRGAEIVAEYTDMASGTTGTAGRPGLKTMLEDAHRGAFDTLFFWSVDRLTRQGIRSTFEILSSFESSGITYYSAKEPEVTNAGPMGELFIAIRGYFAAIERERLSERTRAGLERARREGKTIGRPRRVLDSTRMYDMHQAGASYRQIADACGTDAMTVHRRLRGRGR